MSAQRAGGLVQDLQAAVHRLLSHLDAELASLRLTPAEVNLLAQFSECGESLTVAELTRRTGQRPSTITGILDRLARRKLIRRTVNPRDRRSFLISLTAGGRRAAFQVADAFAAVEREITSRTSPGTLERLYELLGALGALGSSAR